MKRKHTWSFPSKHYGDNGFSCFVAGDTGVCVVQVLQCHFIYDGLLCDRGPFKIFFLPPVSKKKEKNCPVLHDL